VFLSSDKSNYLSSFTFYEKHEAKFLLKGVFAIISIKGLICLGPWNIFQTLSILNGLLIIQFRLLTNIILSSLTTKSQTEGGGKIHATLLVRVCDLVSPLVLILWKRIRKLSRL